MDNMISRNAAVGSYDPRTGTVVNYSPDQEREDNGRFGSGGGGDSGSKGDGKADETAFHKLEGDRTADARLVTSSGANWKVNLTTDRDGNKLAKEQTYFVHRDEVRDSKGASWSSGKSAPAGVTGKYSVTNKGNSVRFTMDKPWVGGKK